MRYPLHRATLFLCISSLSACVINNNKFTRPRDLEDSWSVTKPRLLAVQAVPAEPRPGEVVSFRALLADPNGEIESILWIACPSPDDGGTGFGCIADSEEVIGLQPLQQPIYTTPLDLLDGLDERARQEGRYVLVQVTGLPPLDLTEPEIDFENIDFNEVEAGYKRIIISEATTPNNNPALLGTTADGADLPPGSVLEVDPGQDYDIGVILDDRTIEEYLYLTREGFVEQRTEEPYVTWYATAGEVAEPYTLYPFLEATWTAPEEPGTEGTLWAVARDRRGGQDWLEINFRVR